MPKALVPGDVVDQQRTTSGTPARRMTTVLPICTSLRRTVFVVQRRWSVTPPTKTGFNRATGVWRRCADLHAMPMTSVAIRLELVGGPARLADTKPSVS
jgi:hypothetical protein